MPKNFDNLSQLDEEEVRLLVNAFSAGVNLMLSACAMINGNLERAIEHQLEAQDVAIRLHELAHPFNHATGTRDMTGSIDKLIARINKLGTDHNDHVIASDMLGNVVNVDGDEHDS